MVINFETGKVYETTTGNDFDLSSLTEFEVFIGGKEAVVKEVSKLVVDRDNLARIREARLKREGRK